MSEHKTGLSNWTADDKRLYLKRRYEGLRGQIDVATVHRSVKEEKGNDQRMPLGSAIGSRLSRGKHSERCSALRQHWQAFNRQQRKVSARGE